MSEDLSNMVNNIKKMIDNDNIPDNMKAMLKNLSNSSDNKSSAKNKNNSFDIDIKTILKMKSVIDALNKKDDPRANLLYSLKPYLRESRKGKIDQYINFLNIAKVADIMKNENKEDRKNDF